MFKDVYLFTNGVVRVFDDRGNQMRGIEGLLTDELRNAILDNLDDGARITLSRWKKGFFLLSKEEFANVQFEGDTMVLRFKRKSIDETDSAN